MSGRFLKELVGPKTIHTTVKHIKLFTVKQKFEKNFWQYPWTLYSAKWVSVQSGADYTYIKFMTEVSGRLVDWTEI